MDIPTWGSTRQERVLSTPIWKGAYKAMYDTTEIIDLKRALTGGLLPGQFFVITCGACQVI